MKPLRRVYKNRRMQRRILSPEEEELASLTRQIGMYEKEHFPIDVPQPVEAVNFWTNADMVQHLGSPEWIAEVFNGKRAVSKIIDS